MPDVDLVSAPVPPSLAEIEPDSTAKELPVSTPVVPVMEPDVSVTAPTVSETVSMLKVLPLLTATAPVSASRPESMSASVPAEIVVPPE